MLVRLWKTKIDESREHEYEHNEQNRSEPMFRKQKGCLGALFMRSQAHCFALTFWENQAAVDALSESATYKEATDFYASSGMCLGKPSLQVFEVKSGFLNETLFHTPLGKTGAKR